MEDRTIVQRSLQEQEMVELYMRFRGHSNACDSCQSSDGDVEAFFAEECVLPREVFVHHSLEVLDTVCKKDKNSQYVGQGKIRHVLMYESHCQ